VEFETLCYNDDKNKHTIGLQVMQCSSMQSNKFKRQNHTKQHRTTLDAIRIDQQIEFLKFRLKDGEEKAYVASHSKHQVTCIQTWRLHLANTVHFAQT